MALSNESYKTVFVCNGVVQDFDTDFKIFAQGDEEIILYTIATAAETTLTLTTDYALSLLTDTGFRITTVATYSSAYKLIARRKKELTQELDYTPNSFLSTPNLEEQLDKIVMQMQRIQEQLDRAIKFDSSVSNASTVITLPTVTATIADLNINALSVKAAPVDADEIAIADSAAGYVLKKILRQNIMLINGFTEKTTLADNDWFLIEDSADSNAKKKVKRSNVAKFLNMTAQNILLTGVIAGGTPPANTLYADTIIKGLADVDQTGTQALDNSFNVSSITDGGVGITTITWDVDFADTDYIAVASAGLSQIASIYTRAVGTLEVRVYTDAGAGVDADPVMVIATGTQA